MIYIWIDILIDRIYNNVKIKYGLIYFLAMPTKQLLQIFSRRWNGGFYEDIEKNIMRNIIRGNYDNIGGLFRCG